MDEPSNSFAILEARSLGRLLHQSCMRYADRTAMLCPSKQGFQPLSYRQLWEKVKAYAGALRSAGLRRGDKLAILADNSPEWAFTDWAAQTLGIITVPIFPTLTADQATFIVTHSEAKAVVVDSGAQRKKVESIPGMQVLMLEGGDDSLDAIASRPGTTIDEARWLAEMDSIGFNDLATIIYTSGTTGEPKGVMLAHRTFLHVCEYGRRQFPVNENDVFFSFLPMSHVFERIAGQTVPLAIGACIAYSRGMRTLLQDFEATRPTIMMTVPRFLDAILDRVVDNVAKQSWLSQKLFWVALKQGLRRAAGKFAPLTPILDKLVLGKVRSKLGGRLRCFVAGGAALPLSTWEFYSALGILVLQGYGLTETGGGSCVNHPERNRPETVGEPLGVELAIAPDGEILIRGTPVMLGYYKRPDDTTAAIDAQGYFHTGDIGELIDKYLKITDRKKDLLILGNGKNVAPQPIENRLVRSPLIRQAVLFGDGMKRVCAIILPHMEHLRQSVVPDRANEKDDAILADKRVEQAVRTEIDRINRELADFERVGAFRLIQTPFTIESGELTPTMKVKRRAVRDKYAELIQSMDD